MRLPSNWRIIWEPCKNRALFSLVLRCWLYCSSWFSSAWVHSSSTWIQRYFISSSKCLFGSCLSNFVISRTLDAEWLSVSQLSLIFFSWSLFWVQNASKYHCWQDIQVWRGFTLMCWQGNHCIILLLFLMSLIFIVFLNWIQHCIVFSQIFDVITRETLYLSTSAFEMVS